MKVNELNPRVSPGSAGSLAPGPFHSLLGTGILEMITDTDK